MEYYHASTKLALIFLQMGQWRLAYLETRGTLLQARGMRALWPDVPISDWEIVEIEGRERKLRGRLACGDGQMI